MAIIVRGRGAGRCVEDAGQAERGASLARQLWRAGVDLPPGLCLGLGRCGRCRARFLAAPPGILPVERDVFSPAELAAGWRLLCRHAPADGMELELPPLAGTDIRDAAPAAGAAGIAAATAVDIAVDAGTTSIAWSALGPDGERLTGGQTLNPQMGADVMSRLSGGPEDVRRQHARMADFLRDLTERLERGGLRARSVTLAANPAMTALALGTDVSGLLAAPYRLDDAGNRAAEVEGLPPLWIPPQIGPFVGGDAAAGLALLLDAPRPFILADMGTNGECALVDGEGGLAASVPLGPALEGVGMRCGGLAGPGAAIAFRIGPDGLTAETWDHGPATHIAGTGYLSLIHLLRKIGLLGPEGAIAPPLPGAPLGALRDRLAAAIRRGPGGWSLPLTGGGLTLDGADVESLLKVKAAFSLALDRLMAAAGLPPERLNRLYLAGALGWHAPLDALEGLGFIPPALARVTVALGNASLRGAELLARDGALRERLARLTAGISCLDLTADPAFQTQYIARMRFDGWL